ncbi:hypothetical protein ABIB56_003497, partial [Glaciihabitans sp. UYNi722]
TSLPIRQNKNHNPRWPYFQLAKVALFSVGVNTCSAPRTTSGWQITKPKT